MLQCLSRYTISSALPVVIVISASGIVTMAITAWLVNAVARRAIEKASPGDVAPVILALSALLNPLRGFMSWVRSDRPGRHDGPVTLPEDEPDNEVMRGLGKEFHR